MSNQKYNGKRRILSLFGASIGWFAVLGQLLLIIINRQADVLETIIRFFSYFTILTNVLIALYFTAQIFNLKILKFLKSNSALTAVTAFILIVGLVYQFVLRSIWEPTGLQLIIDELLHTIIPTYVLLYWFLYIQHHHLKPQNLLTWLLYPLIYIIFILIRGHFSGFYPYPFIDVQEIGYLKVFSNFISLSVIILVLMGLLYLFAQFFKKYRP